MVDFFHLNPKFFPATTKNHLPVETILRLGALPLGSKRGVWPFRRRLLLNVGLVNPKDREAVSEIKRCARVASDFNGLQLYRLAVDEFLSIVQVVYGLTRESLLALPETHLEPSLRQHLDAVAAS